MYEWFDAAWHTLQQYRLWLMFAGAFSSATVLPGNSEALFVGFAVPLAKQNGWFSAPVFKLLLAATAGNSLGSMTSYLLGRLIPERQKAAPETRGSWAYRMAERWGSLILLLAWLPVVGDVFCAAAGWLRLRWLPSLLCITLGKLIRYALLLLLAAGIF